MASSSLAVSTATSTPRRPRGAAGLTAKTTATSALRGCPQRLPQTTPATAGGRCASASGGPRLHRRAENRACQQPLAHAARSAGHRPRKLYLKVSDTRPLAGETPVEVLAERVRRADVVVCLLTISHLGKRARDDLGNALVVPVAVEHLAPAIDLRGFDTPFALDGCAFAGSHRKPLFSPACAITSPAGSGEPRSRSLVPGAGAARRRRPDRRRAGVRRRWIAGRRDVQRVDPTVDVQEYLHEWAAT